MLRGKTVPQPLLPDFYVILYVWFPLVTMGRNVTKWATSTTIFVNEFWPASLIGCRNMLNIIPLFVTNNGQAPVSFIFTI